MKTKSKKIVKKVAKKVAKKTTFEKVRNEVFGLGKKK